MSVVTRLESKFGHLAIPNLIRVIAVFQLMNWFLIHASPRFVDWLVFDSDAILHGEVWRLVSFALIPGSLGLLWLFCGMLFLWMLSDGLESAWGAFRVNLYLLAGVIFSCIGGFLGPVPDNGMLLWTSVLFAFAYYYPDFEIMLLLLVPVKMKWVAWLTAGSLIFFVLGAPSMLVQVLFGLLNFFLVFAPGFMKDAGKRAQVAGRRRRFDAAKRPESEALHCCHVCGKTSLVHPSMGFRVTAAGEDVCDDCRTKKNHLL